MITDVLGKVVSGDIVNITASQGIEHSAYSSQAMFLDPLS